MRDPAGYYAALGVERDATPQAIVSAFRRKARVLHPDVPETGNVAAFIRVKEAYEVLSHVDRRAAYDRAADDRLDVSQWPAPTVSSPRFAIMAIAVWAGLGGLLVLAAVLAVVQFHHPRLRPPVLATAHPAPLTAPADRPAPLPWLAATENAPTTHYVLPAGNDTIVWRRDSAQDVYLPAGLLAAFAPVQALGLVPEHGLVKIGLADGGVGFVDAVRLALGDRLQARQAYCAYNAGTPPANGEVLQHRGQGTAHLQITNQGAQAAVIKLRDASGQAAATVYVAPGDNATVDLLPNITYRPDFAVGDLWSRACNGFAAGMRAQRFPGFSSLSGLSPLVIPPDLSAGPAPVDIPDAAFERD